MTATDRAALLQRVPLFADARLDAAALDQLAGVLRPHTYAKGAPIFREGDAAAEMFLVARGRVGIFKQAGPTRTALAELGEGAYFGEVALLDGGKRSADADALEDVELLGLAVDAFDALIERHPRVALAFLRATSRRLRATTTQIAADDGAGASADIDDDPVCERYPFPIAAVWRSLAVQIDPRVRVERLFDLLEVTTRYLGIVSVSGYLAGGRASEFVDETLLGGLSKQTIGGWLRLLREGLEPWANDPAALFVPELWDFTYTRPGRRSPVMKRLEAVVEFRNQQRHGGGGAISERDLEARLAEHVPAMREVLDALAFLADYPPIWVERMDYSKGAFVYRYQRCTGSHPDFETATLTLKEPRETGELYLLHRSGGAILPLHPLLVLDACGVCTNREMFMIHGGTPEAVDYVEFVRGHHHAMNAPAEDVERLRGEARARLHAAEKAPAT